ncbi:MAG: Sec-independent protein translocase protein TatB [Thermomonas sp.]
MFDFSFGEMLLVGLVALVVLGPERLPKAARFVGLWVRRARAQWYSVKSELERELASEELRRSLADGQQVMRETEAELRSADAQFRTAVSNTVAEVQAPSAPLDGPEVQTPVEPLMEHPLEDEIAAPMMIPAAPPASDATETSRQDTHGQ